VHSRTGQFTGPLYGAPPSGRDVHLREILFYSFRDGKVGEIREHYDQQSLLIDLGVLENTIGRVAVPKPDVMLFTPADDLTTPEEMKAIQLIHRDAEFEQRFDDLIATVHPDACWEDVPTGSLRRGIDGVSRHYAAYFKAFPGWSLQRRSFHDAGKHLLSESFLIVQHDGPWYEVPPSHREVRLPLAVVFYFKEGKVLGEREYYDRLTWRRLLGAD
jgi:predicted ester cyclase